MKHFQGQNSFAKLFNVNGKCATNCKEFYIMYLIFIDLININVQSEVTRKE